MADGDTWHIGGTLEVEDGATVSGLKAANVADVSSTTGSTLKDKINEILAALKDGGLMAGDAWNVSVLAVPGGSAQMPTPETIANSAHATFAIDGTEITITLDCKVSELADADHGATWGVHKWLGFGVRTGLDSIVGVKYNGTALTAGDASEASDLGLSAGDFVLYIKAEDPAYLAGTKSVKLAYTSKETTEFTMKIVEPAPNNA